MENHKESGYSDRVIRILSDNLANKIAAGEVVQRPASVVKELVENAIDAGADEITVLIRQSGRELVHVIDNGCGMSRVDASTCFERHATSKIQSVEDLERIRTLGFRGEALASIAAVAQVELRTRRVQDEAGTRIRINGGHHDAPEPVAMAAGTSIAVRNLFYNVPARRNFLKSPATELKHIQDVFQSQSLSHPEIAFSLDHDDRTMYSLSAHDQSSAGMQSRIADLLGREPEQLIPVDETASYLRLSGFIGKPAFTKKSRGEQFLFVNDRYIKSSKLDHAVWLGYGEMLPRGSYPFFSLSLSLDPAHVDVNVHPTKTEVQFDDESGIFGFIRGSVRNALASVDISPRLEYGESGRLQEKVDPLRTPSRGGYQGSFTDTEGFSGSPSRTPNSFTPSGPDDRRDAEKRGPLGSLTDALYQGWTDSRGEESALDETIPEAVSAIRKGEIAKRTWQIHDKYVLIETASGMVIMDQHAAHERVLYERFRTAIAQQSGSSQQVLFPVTVSFSPGDFALLTELLDEVKAIGFDLEVLSGRAIVVNGVPDDLPQTGPEIMLESLLDQFKSYRDDKDWDVRDNLAASMACRNAIKTGKTLSSAEIEHLVDQLFACEMPYACPHGRPTMIRMSVSELDRRFGRVGHLAR